MSTRIVPRTGAPPVPAQEIRTHRPVPWRALVPALLLALMVVVVLGAARGLGAAIRRAALIETRITPPESGLEFSDSPTEATRFFADRDEVTIRIPRDITVAEFLALYHLGNRPDVRAALREQLDATEDTDLLREGEELTIHLTPVREGS